MSSTKDYSLTNCHQTCIDDIVNHYDSLSLSSSETDNITLDSGIYFDSKSDVINKSFLNAISKDSLPPPPPPPYNSYHKIISSNPDSTDINMSFQFEKLNNIVSNSNSISDDKYSTHDSSSNQRFENQSSRRNNQFSLTRLLTEEKKQHKRTLDNAFQSNKMIESPFYQCNPQNSESEIKNKIVQKPDHVIESNLLNQLNNKFQITRQSQSYNSTITQPTEDTKILGTCNKCQCLVTDSESACIALGNLYHSSCFTCCYCNRSLRGKVFYKDQEKIYCENDYMVFGFHKSVKICCACGHIVTETILEALGKDFHPRCFKCSICQKCLDGIPFTVDRNNNIYCILDYHNTFAPRCAICLKPIIPRKDSDEVVRIVVNDRDFHVDCYRCQNCLTLLSNESNCFVWATDRSETNVKLLCRKCYVNQMREISRLN